MLLVHKSWEEKPVPSIPMNVFLSLYSRCWKIKHTTSVWWLSLAPPSQADLFPVPCSWWPCRRPSCCSTRTITWSRPSTTTGWGSARTAGGPRSSRRSSRRRGMAPPTTTPTWPSAGGLRRCRPERWPGSKCCLQFYFSGLYGALPTILQGQFTIGPFFEL